MKHTQQTFLLLGDEFLVQYFLTAHKDFRQSQILSRLFSMGHSLELYAKAALVSPNGAAPKGHDVSVLISQFDHKLALTDEEIEAGKSLFDTGVKNVDLGTWTTHQEAMELYQAQFFLKDLKYYTNKEGNIIYPARMSLKPINERFLCIVKALRTSLEHREEKHDQDLIHLIGLLGFEENPALRVIPGE